MSDEDTVPPEASVFRKEALEHRDNETRGRVLLMKSPRPRRAIPLVQQFAETECAAACLTMVLRYWRKDVTLDEVREVLGPGRDGLTAYAIKNAAEHFGLRVRPVRLELDELDYVDRGTILHWSFDHFVVFDRATARRITIIDPAVGARTLPKEEVSRQFTGIALLFEPDDRFRPEKRSHSLLWAWIGRVLRGQRRLFVQAVVASMILQLFALSIPAATGVLVDRVVEPHDTGLMPILSVGILSLIAFNFAAAWVRARLLVALSFRIDAGLTRGFLDHLVTLPYPFFQLRHSGDLMMRMNANTVVREHLTSGAVSAILDGVLVSSYLAILVVAHLAMAGLVLVIALAYVGVYLIAAHRKRAVTALTIAAESRAQSFQYELLNGMETLKSLGAERRAADRWWDLYVNVLNANVRRGRLDALVDTAIESLRLGAPLLVLLAGSYLALQGDLSLGEMFALAAVASGFLSPLSKLVETAMRFNLLSSHMQRIDDVLDARSEQHGMSVRPAPTLQGRIQLEDVTFRYAPSSPLVLRGLSGTVEPGAFVAVVGRSGAGKTSLVALLTGLYPATAGRVLYDGIDLQELDVRSLRARLGVVTQNAYLFGGTIAENIALAVPSASREQIVEAATRARIHEDIAELPMGYDTRLVDRGASLSGGQRQRLALARALLAQPSVLILDEATSALDAITEAAIFDELARLRCTRIVIAHRLSTVERADEIWMLDAGTVVERGSHIELLARRGAYAALYQGGRDQEHVQRSLHSRNVSRADEQS